MRHHRAAWRVERVGWAVGALALAATLLGAFGDGPLSHARRGSAGTLEVEYERLVRSSAPTALSIRVDPSVTPSGVLQLRIDQALVDRMEIDSIVPGPERQQAGPGYTQFLFNTAAGTTPAAIEFRFAPATFGKMRGGVSVEGRHRVLIEQYAYP
ncbi:hypothetical protein [Agrilutibacter solisilvae]|uniref:Uncharacterized protein n=1 Tax=Agrilutibacter solisilvae TaxID=2763317 RepID=A0A975ASG2_9GAMM|nr:hypothetical protein [Lysobacter solisilvae]QSX78904.1 hypothetical protein I8J32_002975 [Lysobacter solisilvae]